MKTKKLHVNALLNMLRTVLTILFPLITLPYINRILGIENVGKINFVSSYMSYFILLSGLGIPAYAVREGAKVKDSKEKLSKLVSQLFSLNVLATGIAYLLLFLSIFFIDSLKDYLLLLIIQSITILGTTISVSWFFTIIEDFLYVTLRTILFQIVSILLIFLFVHTREDLLNYAWILVVSQSGSSILNFLYLRRFVDLRLTLNLELKKHFKPIFILFATSVAMVIYVNSDMTMLGFLSGDYEVGLYATSVRIYTIVKNILASLLAVTTPRLSYYLIRQEDDKFARVIEKTWMHLVLIMFPIMAGLYLLSDKIIVFIAGETFIPASRSLQILVLAIFFALLATFLSTCLLLPKGKESKILKATFYSAILNIICNFFLIPLFHQNGAAWTTVLAEFTVALYLLRVSGFRLSTYWILHFKLLLSTVIMSGVIYIFIENVDSVAYSLLISPALGIIIYFLVSYLLGVEIVISYCSKIRSRILGGL